MPDTPLGRLVAASINERPTCADCIALKAGVTPDEVLAVIDRMLGVVRLDIGVWARCQACGVIGGTYSLTRT
jgi:hypothetical protein